MALFTREQLYRKSGDILTQKLFYEFNKVDPLMNLASYEKGGTLPIRNLFIPMVAVDPTEVEFAEHVFGDYSFWETFLDRTQSWTGDQVAEWRRLSEIKRKSMAFRRICDELSDGRSGISAAKYLIEESWKDMGPEDKRKRRKKNRETAQQAFEESGVSEDLKRLRQEGLIQ